MPDWPVLFGAGLVLLFGFFAWSLCRVAADSDRRIEQRADRLAEVAHLGEQRARRDARNGIGRVGKAS